MSDVQTRELLQLPVSSIIPHPANAEIYGSIQPEQGMTDSIREHGVLTRIVVTPIEDEGGQKQYRLISGERRLVNAIAAGIAYVPVEVREYDSPADEILALVEYNHAREETERQKVSKIETYKIALSDRAEARSLQNLRRGEERGVPDGDDAEEYGRTDELIAERLGITRRKVNDLIAVWSNVYRDHFLAAIAECYSPKQGVVAACIQRWDNIRRDRECGRLSLSKAAQEVALLKRELEEVAAGRKRKPAAAKEKKAKPIYPPRPLTPEDGFMEVWKMPIAEDESVGFGMVWKEDGVPDAAIVMRGQVVSIPWEDLFAQHGKLVLPTLPRPAEVEHEIAQDA